MDTAMPPDPWEQLARLGAAAADDTDFQPRFAAALAGFHAAGWTYRVLGEALGVSHEFIRQGIKNLPAGAPAFGISVPQRPKSLTAIPLRSLDPVTVSQVTGALKAAEAAGPEPRTGSGLRVAVADYFAVLHAALAAGWDAHSVAAALQSHPKAVFKFAAQHERYREGSTPALPPAPDTEVPALARATRPALPAVAVPERARQELQQLDSGSGNPLPEQYLSLLGRWYLRGASRQELETASAQQWETARKRLVSGGYMAGRRGS